MKAGHVCKMRGAVWVQERQLGPQREVSKMREMRSLVYIPPLFQPGTAEYLSDKVWHDKGQPKVPVNESLF